MKKVLIVDDNVDSLSLLEMLLQESGFKAESVSEWQLAYEKVNSFKPDLLLLDVSLDGVDGRIIAKNLKSNPETRPIKIILISGDKQVEEDYRQYQADDFLAKPFDMAKLKNKINHQLNSQEKNYLQH